MCLTAERPLISYETHHVKSTVICSKGDDCSTRLLPLSYPILPAFLL